MNSPADIVRELGGDPEATDDQNLQILANEIIILREKVRQAEDGEGRAERRVGKEIEARSSAEAKASVAEDALAAIDSSVARAKRKALEVGAPMRIAEDAAAKQAQRP